MAFERGYVGVWRQIRFRSVTSNFYNEISDTDWRKRAFVGPDAKYADYSDITNLTAAQFANLPAMRT